MIKENIIKGLADILHKDCESVRSYPPNASLSEIGLTSLLLVSLIIKYEELFGIEILDSDLVFDNFSTIAKIQTVLSKYHQADEMKKVLIVDADDVLWKNISGEEEIIIDRQVLQFQDLLLNLYEKGVLLCLCSKNKKAIISTAFANPQMLVKKEHFVIFHTSKHNKASSILNISQKLGLPTSSFVFVDDSQYELGFVNLNLPDVTTILADYKDFGFCGHIKQLFDKTQNLPDQDRTKLYRAQIDREKQRKKFTSVMEYNRFLNTQLVCRKATEADCSRLADMSQRIHQFNLSNKKYEEAELHACLSDSSCQITILSASDNYGDMGIVGMAVVRVGTIEAFMLSCRVLDRGFECVLLNHLKSENALLKGCYHPNGKNMRYKDFYRTNGVTQYDN